MNDDEMDQMLIRAAQDYNQPGPVPRDAIWARIAEARGITPANAGLSRRAPGRIWRWTGIGIAAALILSAGIAIGRHAATQQDSLVAQIHQETQKTGRRAEELSQNVQSADPHEQSLAYRLVVLRHLAGTEAMIATFRSTTQRGAVDAELARWSRELLSTTRLLETSQASDDPVMQRLLEDLDLVISQIVQYTARGTVNTEELDLIEQSINRRNVITKLRSVIPPGGLPAGT